MNVKAVLRGLFAGGLLLFAAHAGAATMAGSDHDLSGRGWGTDQMCKFCHTPHNSITSVGAAPLWNHTVTTSTYTPYTSPTLTATVGQPGSYSKLCLSCHDGTIAIDSFQGRTGTNNITGSALIGTNLSNDHPVGFTYNTALSTADGGLRNPSSYTVATLGGTIQAKMLFADQLECASCHNVHDPQYGNFLKMANTGSALCLACHNK